MMNELLYFTEAVRNTLSSTKGASIADRCETLLYYSDEQIQTYGYLDMRKKSRFITTRKVWGKVMFLHLSVSHSVHRGCDEREVWAGCGEKWECGEGGVVDPPGPGGRHLPV